MKKNTFKSVFVSLKFNKTTGCYGTVLDYLILTKVMALYSIQIELLNF